MRNVYLLILITSMFGCSPSGSVLLVDETPAVTPTSPNASSPKLLQVDIHSDGTLPNGPVIARPAMSRNGRYVVFSSTASNLVDNDTNGVEDVFLHDLVARTTIRVSVASDRTEGNGASGKPEISGDGKVIFFSSSATNLVAGDVNGVTDVFRHVIATGVTDLISKSQAGVAGNALSSESASSFDGSVVAFTSKANNLGPLALTKSGSGTDIVVRNLITGVTTYASEHRTAGVRNGALNGANGGVNISADGLVVGFHSTSSSILSGDVNGQRDAIYFNIANDTVDIISANSANVPGDGTSWVPRLSETARYSTFHSALTHSVPAAEVGLSHTFRKDMQTGELQVVSLTDSGAVPNGGCAESGMSLDGSFVVFQCGGTSDNYVNSDTNGATDIFMRDITLGRTILISRLVDGQQLNGDSTFPLVSGDGSSVVFNSLSSNVPGCSTDGGDHVYVRTVDSSLY